MEISTSIAPFKDIATTATTTTASSASSSSSSTMQLGTCGAAVRSSTTEPSSTPRVIGDRKDEHPELVAVRHHRKRFYDMTLMIAFASMPTSPLQRSVHDYQLIGCWFLHRLLRIAEPQPSDHYCVFFCHWIRCLDQLKRTISDDKHMMSELTLTLEIVTEPHLLPLLTGLDMDPNTSQRLSWVRSVIHTIRSKPQDYQPVLSKAIQMIRDHPEPESDGFCTFHDYIVHLSSRLAFELRQYIDSGSTWMGGVLKS